MEDDGSMCEWSGWLKTNSIPESKVLHLWRKTAKARLSFIHCDKPVVNDILKEWPRYSDDQGTCWYGHLSFFILRNTICSVYFTLHSVGSKIVKFVIQHSAGSFIYLTSNFHGVKLFVNLSAFITK